MVVTKKDQILVGHKSTDGQHVRFPGGFVDPCDLSLEMAASRELTEEIGMIEVTPWSYCGSARVNDYRYRSSVDKICTVVFTAEYVFGALRAADDLDWCGWMPQHEAIAKMSPIHNDVLSLWISYKERVK